eukprot:12631364-Heterocapsa_arctica.AAC.1
MDRASLRAGTSKPNPTEASLPQLLDPILVEQKLRVDIGLPSLLISCVQHRVCDSRVSAQTFPAKPLVAMSFPELPSGPDPTRLE